MPPAASPPARGRTGRGRVPCRPGTSRPGTSTRRPGVPSGVSGCCRLGGSREEPRRALAALEGAEAFARCVNAGGLPPVGVLPQGQGAGRSWRRGRGCCRRAGAASGWWIRARRRAADPAVARARRRNAFGTVQPGDTGKLSSDNQGEKPPSIKVRKPTRHRTLWAGMDWNVHGSPHPRVARRRRGCPRHVDARRSSRIGIPLPWTPPTPRWRSTAVPRECPDPGSTTP